MASSNIKIKIHEQCIVAPPKPETTQSSSLPLTFFDLIWIRFYPVEYVFSYTLLRPSSFFFEQVVPKLKTSLSQSLQHFLPLAGDVVWPSDSNKPFLQYNPGDGVSLVVAESNADFKDILENSPREASETRSLLPHLETSDSRASVISLQITLFPNKGFSIGVSSYHLAIDAKSLAMFIKAWASLCQQHSSLSLAPELVPFFDREVIKDPNDRGVSYANGRGRSLKIPPFQPKEEVDAVRATFELTHGDLDKLKKKVLSKWEGGEEIPTTLSRFVLTSSYVLVCIAKTIQGVENKRNKFGYGMSVDCRSRLEPPIPNNFCGNCVWAHFVDVQPTDFTKEDGLVVVAKSIHNKIKLLNEGVIKAAESGFAKYEYLLREGVEMMAVAGSHKFGMYGIDFGWGRPAKVEMVSVDRDIVVGMTENKDGNGVEFAVVLNKRLMDLFSTLFHAGLCHD